MADMANSLANPMARSVLDRLFAAAEQGDGPRIAAIAARHGKVTGSGTAIERAALFGELYIPISPECGRMIYSLIRAGRPQTVVEFGTSFGIGTIHLAAAVRDNGTGKVISTELNAGKAQRAREHLAEAGLADVAEVVTGDALEVLAAVPGPIGFALIDGWKELYLDLLRVIEPQLAPGALVVADDTVQFATVVADYLSYVRDEANGYVSVAFLSGDGVEVSCRA
jgi:predicted O-methyltransferase YrrM